MALPAQFITDLKARNPISEVIGSYVPLKRVGRNVKCKCPFHNETDASFVVYNDSQSFYCFGCGAAGDVISFVMKIESLDYMGAIHRLADRAGMAIPAQDKRAELQEQNRKKVLEINKASAHFYYNCLKEQKGLTARRYLKGRGILSETITRFGLGYAPQNWDDLTLYLKKEGFSEEELLLAAVSAKGKKGSLYDIFRDRVMIPIINIRGEVIGFGGRILEGTGPKYLNSADTLAFKKTRNLFAMNFAKNQKEPFFLLTEGYLDVISLHQAGFLNAVASLGTALTTEQAYLLSNYKSEVILSYDSDPPGQKATQRAIAVFDKLPVKVRVLQMAGAKDPDEFLQKNTPERFAILIQRALPAPEFLLESAKAGLDLSEADAQVTYLRQALENLHTLSDKGEQTIYAGKLAKELEMDKNMVLDQLHSLKSPPKRTGSKDSRQANKQKKHIPLEKNRVQKVENELIAALYHHPTLFRELDGALSPSDFFSSDGIQVAHILMEQEKKGLPLSLDTIRDQLEEPAMARLIYCINTIRNAPINPSEMTRYVSILKKQKEQKSVGEIRTMPEDELSQYIDQIKKNKGKRG